MKSTPDAHVSTEAQAAPITILRQSAVVQRLGGIHPTTIYRWEKQGRFPRRVQLGPNSVGWLAQEVEAWLASREVVGVKS